MTYVKVFLVILLVAGVIEVILSIIFNSGIMPETQQGVVKRLGTISNRAIGKGPYFRLFLLHKVERVDSKDVQTPLEVPAQELLMETTTPIGVRLSLTVTIYNAPRMMRATAGNYAPVAIAAAETVFFRVLAGRSLESLESEREQSEADVRAALTPVLRALGIGIGQLGFSDVRIPEELRKSLIRPAAARYDAMGDETRARKIAQLLGILTDAVKEKGPGDLTEREIFDYVMDLMKLATAEDSAGGAVLMGLGMDRPSGTMAARQGIPSGS